MAEELQAKLDFHNQVTSLMQKYSRMDLTDKAQCHSYEHLYPELLWPFKDKAALNILEFGISYGGSLALWHDIFPQAEIYGVDMDLGKMTLDFNETKQIHVFAGKQQDSALYSSLFQQCDTFDIVIDDCSHQIADQIYSFYQVQPHLRANGIYVIEDIYPHHQYPEEFQKLFKRIDLTHIKNRGDDVVFFYQKPA